ncbi:hypothetical protein VE03_05499 [Pseudogymnoascus sp. 23342-1-I1]|nr:hypothetical protein VE03_05499 [Pseudogymnoascus sp. 23342-1-I1]
MPPHSLRLRRSLDSNKNILIGTIVVSSVLGTLTIVGLYFLFRYCRQRRRNRRSMMNSAEEAWKKQHVAGAWSIDSSEPVSELQGTETTSEPYMHSEPPNIRHNDRFLPGYTQTSAYVAVRSASPPPRPARSDSPTLPLLVVHHNRSVSMPPPRPPRPDDMISPLTPRDIAEIPDHLLYNSDSITSRGGEEYRPYSLPAKSPIHRPEVHPPPESHPLPQPPYDSPIDLWYQPPSPPPKSDRRPARIRSINRKVSIVRKPVPIHYLLSAPKYGGLGGLGGLRRSDTGYSSHYSDASNLERADSVASMAGRHTWAPQSAIDSLATYSEISDSTPFDKTEGLERNLSRRDFASARLSNVVEKEDANEAAKLEGDSEVPDLESDTTSNAGSSDRDTLEVEKKVGEESRVNTPDPIPAPLRIIKKGHELEVPTLKLPMPMSFEERREMGKIYAVR